MLEAERREHTDTTAKASALLARLAAEGEESISAVSEAELADLHELRKLLKLRDAQAPVMEHLLSQLTDPAVLFGLTIARCSMLMELSCAGARDAARRHRDDGKLGGGWPDEVIVVYLYCSRFEL